MKIIIRQLLKNKIHSTINILGLALGMVCALFILLWVQDELSFDRFHDDAEKIYRVIDIETYSNGEVLLFSTNPPDLGPLLATDYPEIQSALRMKSIGKHVLQYEDKQFNETRILCADQNFFDYFSFGFASGTPENALTEPMSILLTEPMAIKYFGTVDALGKTLRIDSKHDYKVTGVLKTLPSNTIHSFKFIIPFESIDNFGEPKENWNYYAFSTFVKLKDGIDESVVDEKIKPIIKDRFKDALVDLSLQPLTDIHLRSGTMWGMGGNGDIRYIYIFSILAVIVLLLACINFMNLSTARAGNRSMEVGLRKVIGAGKKDLVMQFMGETLIYTFTAFLISLVLLKLFMPVFEMISGKQLSIRIIQDVRILIGFILIAFLTGVISGSYPAFFMSSFNPVKVLKAKSGFGLKGKAFRRVLVSFQFVITIVLIASSMVINQQLHYMRNHKLGYNQRNVLLIDLQNKPATQIELLKREIEGCRFVTSASGVSYSPSYLGHSIVMDDWEERRGEENFLIHILSADNDMVSTLEMQMVQGRFFSREFPSDSSSSLVINEAAMKMMGFDDAVGKRVGDRTVIGVVKDFNFRSLHEKIGPLMINNKAENTRFLIVRVEPTGLNSTINEIESLWKTLVPDDPFEYSFIDEEINDYYKADQKVENVINSFTALALVIAGLGLLGLSMFTAEQRTKEIGIRKVLGAPVSGIILLMTSDFARWVLAANIIAWPLTWYMMNKWLQNYAYRIDLQFWIFVLAGFMALGIAVFTTSWQTLKVATMDPVKTLRYE